MSGDGILTRDYTIRAGNVNAAVENVSVSVTDNAGNVTTTWDSSDLTYNNGPVATYSVGADGRVHLRRVRAG